MRKLFLLNFCLALLTACQGLTSPEEKLQADVLAFAQSYFNLDYAAAMPYVTAESQQWVSFAASNVTQEDLELQNRQEEPVGVDVIDMSLDGNYADSTASATIVVSNFIQPDSIGRAGRLVKEQEFVLLLVKRGAHWQVRMEGPLRSGRPGRD